MMASYSIDIPAPDDNVDMVIGDSLTITFVEDANFCSDSSGGTCFNKALPNGPQDKDYVWNGTATATSTVNHHSVAKNAPCDSPKKRSGNRSIQIGSGMPA